MTRTVLALPWLLVACSDKPAEEELTIVVREDTRRIAEEKQRLEAERQEVAERKKELADIEDNLRKLTGSGGGEDELKDVLKKLQSQTRFFESRSRELDRRAQRLEADEAAATTGDGKTPAAVRGGSTSTRELASLRDGQEALRRDLSSVRATLAGVDAQLRALSEKLDKLPASGAAVPMVRIASGQAVKRGTAEKAHAKAQKMMRRKGLLISDLPPDVQGHNAAIKKAMAEGDYASAYEYANHLQETVKAVDINRPFIDAKMVRTNRLLSERAPDKDIATEVHRRLLDVTTLSTDGKYARANAEINQIVRLLTK